MACNVAEEVISSNFSKFCEDKFENVPDMNIDKSNVQIHSVVVRFTKPARTGLSSCHLEVLPTKSDRRSRREFSASI